MRHFQNQDEEYVAWLERCPAGFVLNLGRKPEPMMHRADCLHLAPEAGISHTTAPKACSLEREELERWGRERGLTIVPCSICET